MASKRSDIIPVLLFLSLHVGAYAGERCGGRKQLDIGVAVNMGSRTGKNVLGCISMAVSDFYASHDHYKTRLVLHTRDSGGDPPRAISSAVYLLKYVKVEGLVVVGHETGYLAKIGNEAKVPVFSFAASFRPTSVNQYPFLVQTNQDEISEFKALATTVSRYKWTSVVLVYEDSDDGKHSVAKLIGSLEEKNIRVDHLTAIDDERSVDDELHRIAVGQQKIFIVHMSPRISSRMFLTAKRMGLMKKGYAWIVTSKTMNQLESMDSEAIEAMQGTLGFKAHIPPSIKLRQLRLRWRNEFYKKNPNLDSGRELDDLGIKVYDTIRALAETIEKLCIPSGTKLLEELSATNFGGFSGQFQILDGRLQYTDHDQVFDIVNVIGKTAKRVGLWTPANDVVKRRRRMAGVETVIWPGFTTMAPRGLLMQPKLKILVPINGGFKQFANLGVDCVTNKPTIKGFSVDVFQAAIHSLPYQLEFELVHVNGDSPGSYNGFVHQVYKQEYDGIVGDLTITANRSSYVHFTAPYTDIGIGTITKCKNNDIWLFLKPLRLDLWLVSAAWCVLTGVAVWFIEHSNSNPEFGGSVGHQIGTIFWFGFSTVFFAHRERLTSNWSRVIVIVWLFVVLILTSTYTATLSSMLTLRKIQFASGRDYVGIQVNNTWVGNHVNYNLNFKGDKVKTYHSPEDYADALSRGSKKGGVGAIVDEIPYLQIFLAKYGADFAMVASEPASAGFGFAFQKKHAKLVQDLSQAISRLREEGELTSLEKKWFNTESLIIPEDNPTAMTMPDNLSLANFGGLFLVSFVCCVLVLLVHFYSILLNRLNYLYKITELIRDQGMFAYMIKKIAPRGWQVQENSPV